MATASPDTTWNDEFQLIRVSVTQYHVFESISAIFSDVKW